MSNTHHHHPSEEDPTTLTVYSAQQQQSQSEAATPTHVSVSAHRPYPEAAAQYQQVVQNADLFLQTLKDFHGSFGTKFMYVPLSSSSVIPMFYFSLHLAGFHVGGGIE